MATIGERIAQRRKELGLTQDKLAEMLNVSSKTVSRWETGKQIPDAVSLLEITKALNMTISAIYGTPQDEETNSHTTVTPNENTVHNGLSKKILKIGTALILIAVIIVLVIGAFHWNLQSKVTYTSEEVPMYKLTSYDHSILEWIKFCNTQQEELYLLSRLRTDAETKQQLACYLIYFPHGCEDTEFTAQYRLGLNGKVLELDFKNATDRIDDTYYLCYLEVEYEETDTLLYLQTYLDGKRVEFSDIGNVMQVNWDHFHLETAE